MHFLPLDEHAALQDTPCSAATATTPSGSAVKTGFGRAAGYGEDPKQW